MGKKVKKARNGQKEKRPPSVSQRIVVQQGTGNANSSKARVEITEFGVPCPHIDEKINLDRLSAKLMSSECPKCEDCRGNSGQVKKGKGKQEKRQGIKSKPESKAIWICLECGHFTCGGAGLPTIPQSQSHAVQHAKRNHHPLVVNYGNYQQIWCFSCCKLIPGVKSENSHKEFLTEVQKILKGRSSEGTIMDVEDGSFESGSVTNAAKSDYSTSIDGDGRAGSLVRGLLNLGNTCFFNSVMQNLLSLNIFRDYFNNLDDSVGPLTAAMRKLFLETSSGFGLRSAINPRSLFGSLCTKAPQFKGYQQHDSHELLRCLIDGLFTEELNTRMYTKSDQAPIACPTFVDTTFGGRLSSTVSCLKCSHSSTIYDPFLDLSLPVPTKKPSPRKTQPVTRGRKSKLPPKRSGKNLPKTGGKSYTTRKGSISNQSTGGKSLDEVSIKPPENGDSELSVSNDPNIIAEDFSAIQKPRDEVENIGELSISSDSITWLDYLEPNPITHETGMASEADEQSAVHSFGSEDALQTDVLSFAALDNVVLAQHAVCQVEEEQNVKTQCIERFLPECALIEEVIHNDVNSAHSCNSCKQSCPDDSSISREDDEYPAQIKDCEVRLHPDKDVSSSGEVLRTDTEVLSAVLADEQDSLDFDGFGDLFNEPEEPKPVDHPISEESDATKTEVTRNSSESDPGEVDNDDVPVSIESCLALFTKPEFLWKDEHGWQCDNCSKILLEQTNRLEKGYNIKNPTSNVGNTCNKVGNMNGDLEKEVNPSDDSSLPHRREIYENGECVLRKSEKSEMIVINLHSDKPEPQTINACSGSLDPSSSSVQNIDPHHEECDSDKNEFVESNLQSDNHESEESGEGGVESENLKVKRDATKSILINKSPSILTIHLKRFTQDARGRLSKLNGHVNFRETIDLTPYMDPRCTQQNKLKYHLVGVVEHMGTMRGGHYVAYVRRTKDNGGDVWFYASDAHVHEASLEEVLRCEAYILFYEGT